ncbi:hypothetical protein JCM10212_006442 [Sporobolomyces blumeae]
MDLDALRRAALSSKKRKLSPPLPNYDPPPPPTTTEREEGEIDDDDNDDDDIEVLSPSHVHPHSSAKALAAAKEESKEIIAQLLSYGIPADYLVSIGVSRDILEIAVAELHLDPSLLPPPRPAALSATSAPFRPAFVARSNSSAPADERCPSFPAPPPADPNDDTLPLATPIARDSETANKTIAEAHPSLGPDPATAEVDFAALEVEKRKKLLARKAALRARNQRKAQSLESELDSLFASAAANANASTTSIAPNGREGTPAPEREPSSSNDSSDDDSVIIEEPGPPAAKRPRHSSKDPPSIRSAADLAAARRSIDRTEETVDVPPSGPFASSNSTLSASTSSSAPSTVPPSLPSASTTTAPCLAPTNAQRRPVATDLDSLPQQRLSDSALSRQRVVGNFGAGPSSGFIRHPSTFDQSVVIEISDDEDEDDDDDGDDDQEGDSRDRSNNGQGRAEGPSTTRRPPASAAGPLASTSTSTSTLRTPASRVPSKSPTPVPSTSMTPATSSSRTGGATDPSTTTTTGRSALEEKEREINRIMERIKAYEERQKREAVIASMAAAKASKHGPASAAVDEDTVKGKGKLDDDESTIDQAEDTAMRDATEGREAPKATDNPFASAAIGLDRTSSCGAN